MDQETIYVFGDGEDGQHGGVLGHLALVYDEFSIRRLMPYLHPEARCLEIGAGASRVPAVMADHCREVVAIDVDPGNIVTHPGVQAIRHDITTGAPGVDFDLVHARAVLAHLPARRDVLRELVAAIRPGGVLVVEEFFSGGPEDCVLRSPDPLAARLFAEYHQALVAVMETKGTTDTSWSRELYGAMRQAGLVEVSFELYARQWHGGEAGCMLPYTVSAQQRDALVGAGLDAGRLDRLRRLLLDPDLVIFSNLLGSVAGTKPPA